MDGLQEATTAFSGMLSDPNEGAGEQQNAEDNQTESEEFLEEAVEGENEEVVEAQAEQEPQRYTVRLTAIRWRSPWMKL